MEKKPIKISYIPAQYRVRAEISKADTEASPFPPDDLLLRAKAKLQREKKKGELAFYRVFKTRLLVTWDQLRQSNEPPDTKVGITLATGAPPMPGILVGPPHDEDEGATCIARLTITASSEALQTWGFKLFKLTVGKQLRDMQITIVPDPAKLQTAWKRACWGQSIKDFPLNPVPEVHEEDESGQCYNIILRPDEGEIYLQVHNVRKIVEQNLAQEMLDEIERNVAIISAANKVQYEIQTPDLIRELRSVNRGPERFGIDLPFMWLVALSTPPGYVPMPVVPTKKRKRRASNEGGKLPPSSGLESASVPVMSADTADNPFRDMVAVVIAPNRMVAHITGFNRDLFKELPTFDREAWAAYLASLGVIHGIEEHLLLAIEAKFTELGDLTGMQVAAGTAPVAGKNPFLAPVYKESPVAAMEASATVANMRDVQQRRFVHKGQVIATMKFRDPPVVGMDVCGKPVTPELSNVLDIQIDERVEKKDPLTYVALVDGVPVVEAASISLTAALIINGDVNLTSGNVDFDGPVEIMGSVDAGARVYVRGDLVVHGTVHGAQVKVSGSVTVDGGIVTNELGWIRAKGEISARFMENSRVQTESSIKVARSIIASHIEAKGNIIISEPEGQLIGSNVICLGDVIVAKIGRTGGARTILWLGVDPQMTRRQLKLEHRLAHLTKALAEKQGTLREYRKKSDSQTTQKQTESREDIGKKIAQCEALMKAVTTKLERVKAEAPSNADAKIEAAKLLSANCVIKICDQPIPLPSDLAGVLVTSKRKNGSFVSALQEPVEQAS